MMKFNKTTKEYRKLNSFIRDEMQDKKITQNDIALLLNIPQSAVSRRLRGQTDWTLYEIIIVFDLLGVKFSYEGNSEVV